MNRSALFLSLAAVSLPLISTQAAVDLKQSKFTQVVNDVQVIGADQNATKAEVNGVFKVPDILRTGPNSRAELTADDQTITRVGANTVFSFDPANRTIDLKQGSLLFHSPKGRGGGTVQTGSATASVLGTTIVVTTTPDGGFKVLVLEGNAEIKFLNGLSQQLGPGQMTFILPGGGTSPVIVFRLDEQTKGSKLLNGFDKSLDSQGKINDEIDKQLKLINKDKLKDTGLLVGDKGSASGIEAVDPSVLQSYFHSLTEFVPVFINGGYLTIDGLFIRVQSSEEPATDAFFPALALSVPVTISDAVLDNRHVFVSPVGPFEIVALFNEDLTVSFKNPFQGFFGRNIRITTPNIDMGIYNELSFFDFVAAQDLDIMGSLSFDNAEGQNIYLNALLGGIHIAPNSTLSANANYLGLFSGGAMVFNNVTVQNGGALDVGSFLGMVMSGCSFTSGTYAHFFSGANGINFTDSTINAGSDVYILSQSTGVGATPALALTDTTINGNIVTGYGYGDVNLTRTTIHALDGDVNFTASVASLSVIDSDISAGTVSAPETETLGLPHVLGGPVIIVNPRMINLYGESSATMTGGSLTAETIRFRSSGAVLMDNVAMSGNHLTISTLSASDNDLTLSRMNLSSIADVNISGHTVILTDMNFGGHANITSDSGNVAAGINTHQAVVRGDINMISGNMFNGVLLSEDNRNTYINPEAGNGIYTHAHP